MNTDPNRSRAARESAERALVQVVHEYGKRPEFVVLGGLVPELLCSASDMQHAGTTDIDVQVNLEIVGGSVNAARLEQALLAAGFTVDPERKWRWVATTIGLRTEVKFELLADLDNQPGHATISFDVCETLGAANLRGTGFAADDVASRDLTAEVGGTEVTVEVYFTGLAGFLLAKAAAARSRNAPKDWYDIAFVLLHNDEGGLQGAIDAVRGRFGSRLAGVRTELAELAANFADRGAQGVQAYAEQIVLNNTGVDHEEVLTEAMVAVEGFCRGVSGTAHYQPQNPP